jgi:hypothetical protein
MREYLERFAEENPDIKNFILNSVYGDEKYSTRTYKTVDAINLSKFNGKSLEEVVEFLNEYKNQGYTFHVDELENDVLYDEGFIFQKVTNNKMIFSYDEYKTHNKWEFDNFRKAIIAYSKKEPIYENKLLELDKQISDIRIKLAKDGFKPEDEKKYDALKESKKKLEMGYKSIVDSLNYHLVKKIK